MYRTDVHQEAVKAVANNTLVLLIGRYFLPQQSHSKSSLTEARKAPEGHDEPRANG